MKKVVVLALALVLAFALSLCLPVLASDGTGSGVYSSVWDLDGKRIGVQVGTDYELVVADMLRTPRSASSSPSPIWRRRWNPIRSTASRETNPL